MFTFEERKKAVELYYKYGKRKAAVLRELGYPDRHTPDQRVREFEATGTYKERYIKTKHKYSRAQEKEVVDYYLEHGRSLKDTIAFFGYPGRTTLKAWIDELSPGTRPVFAGNASMRRYDTANKILSVAELTNRVCAAKEVAESLDVSRNALYFWNKKLEQFINAPMSTRKKDQEPSVVISSIDQAKEVITRFQNDIERLKEENAQLEKRKHQAELEVAVLEKAAEILKKDQGINLESLANKEKTMVIDALRQSHMLKQLLAALNLSRSSYHYQHSAIAYDKYVDMRKRLYQSFAESQGSYGYRRLHSEMTKDGTVIS
jgi:putative transposase